GGVHDLDGLGLVLDGADVPAAQAQHADALAGLTERPHRQALAGALVGGARPGQSQGDPGGDTGVQELAAGAWWLTHGLVSCPGRTSKGHAISWIHCPPRRRRWQQLCGPCTLTAGSSFGVFGRWKMKNKWLLVLIVSVPAGAAAFAEQPPTPKRPA